MASRREQNMKYRRYSGRVNGSLAYDPAYEERQRRLRREQEHEQRQEEFIRPPKPKVQRRAAPARRQRERVSPGAVCGFLALAVMVALLILCRAQLTELSAGVVSMQKEPRWEFYRAQLHRLRQVSAIFAVSDYYAIDLMHFLTAHGFSVPGDVSIAGFDDTPMCEMVHPALTTVRQDGALRAKIAVETLRELRKGAHIDPEIRLPVLLVVRSSTGKRNT